MKITKVEPLFLDKFLLVQVHTDEGIIGLGESGSWGFLEASAAAIEKFGRYLIGKGPLLIEHHWQYMYRFSHFRGSAIMGALSALDIALWDIAGKPFDVPGREGVSGVFYARSDDRHGEYRMLDDPFLFGAGHDRHENGFQTVRRERPGASFAGRTGCGRAVRADRPEPEPSEGVAPLAG